MGTYAYLYLFLALVSGTSNGADLTVSAAISLKPALEELAKAFEAETKDKLSFNFGASGVLQQQIENGAPVDVFISASTKQVDALAKIGLLVPDSRRDLLKNELVLVTPKTAATILSFDDLANSTVKHIAVGEPKIVPAGQYAQETFATLKLTEALAPKLILGNSVRQVMTYVEENAVDAGLVYASDALDSTKVRIAAHALPVWHTPIVYPIIVLKKSKHIPEAKRFVIWIGSNSAMSVFRKHGFTAGEEPKI